MKQRYLLPLFLGLGLSSCKTHQDFLTPHPPQLFHDLMQMSKPNGYGLPVGELHAVHHNYLLHARAGIRADKRNYLEILVYHPQTRWGILYRDGSIDDLQSPLDGTLERTLVRDPLADRPLNVSSLNECFSGYVEARTLVASALARQLEEHISENFNGSNGSSGGTTDGDSMTIDRFLSTTPIPRSEK